MYDRDISMDGLKNLPSQCKQLEQIIVKFVDDREMENFIEELKVFGSWQVVVNREKNNIVLNKA